MPAGRPVGSTSSKLFKDALILAVKRTDGDQSKLARIADALVEKALTGDVPACNAVADRLDGKPTQPIGGDEDAAPIIHEIRRTLIDPRSSS